MRYALIYRVVQSSLDLILLYIKGAQEFDEAKRKEIYYQTQRLSQEYLPYIYLVNPIAMGAVRDRILGLKFSALDGPFWNIYELKVTK